MHITFDVTSKNDRGNFQRPRKKMFLDGKWTIPSVVAQMLVPKFTGAPILATGSIPDSFQKESFNSAPTQTPDEQPAHALKNSPAHFIQALLHYTLELTLQTKLLRRL